LQGEAALNTVCGLEVNKFNSRWGWQVSTTKGTGGDLILLEETAQASSLLQKGSNKV